MVFPITAPILTLEILAVILSDTEPTSPEGYETILLKDLGYTKIWLEFRIL